MAHNNGGVVTTFKEAAKDVTELLKRVKSGGPEGKELFEGFLVIDEIKIKIEDALSLYGESGGNEATKKMVGALDHLRRCLFSYFSNSPGRRFEAEVERTKRLAENLRPEQFDHLIQGIENRLADLRRKVHSGIGDIDLTAASEVYWSVVDKINFAREEVMRLEKQRLEAEEKTRREQQLRQQEEARAAQKEARQNEVQDIKSALSSLLK